jgi:NADH-quinone oxidoreductase subunit C
MQYLPSGVASEVLGPLLGSSHEAFGETTLTVAAHSILDVLRKLRDDPKCQFEILIDLAGVDYPQRVQRFDVVYHLLSPRLNQRLRVKIAADEATQVPSAIPVFPNADWYEREAYDMYGILFAGHPLRRREEARCV